MNTTVQCQLCGLQMKTRINGSHLKRTHNLSLQEYIKQFPHSIIGTRTPTKNTYKCKICQKNVIGSNNMSRHLKKLHLMSLESYYINYCNGIRVFCGCGCGTPTTFNNLEKGFKEFIHNHNSPFKKNNDLYKKRKTFLSWNRGLTKHNDERVLKNSISITNSWTEKNLQIRSNSYKTTMLEKYGVENGFQLQSVQEKTKRTMLEKYGVEHPQFSNDIKYKWKYYSLPSGKIVKCQGYEPFGFDILLMEYTENEIINDRKIIPKIKYNKEEKIHIHCPDFFIPKYNLLIDVKSKFTYNINKNQMSLKQKAAVSAGYKYQIYILNDNGTINKIL